MNQIEEIKKIEKLGDAITTIVYNWQQNRLTKKERDNQIRDKLQGRPDREKIAYQRDLLASALVNVLRKVGMLNSDTEPNGAELLMFSEQFCAVPQGDESGLLITDDVGTVERERLKAQRDLTRQEIPEAKRQERERLQALYENMGCVPEEDNIYYQFWQALKEE